MPTVSCSKLTKTYGSITAVNEIDLEVEEGEVLGLLGPNGAGKTTTLRMLLGLVMPSSGTARVLGLPAGDHRALASIGSMVEEPAFYPWLSGRANMQVIVDTGTRVSPGAVDEALERAGAREFAKRRFRSYSQGMRQRLGLAAALLRTPRLLLLDEPTNGLDPEGMSEFRDLVRDVAAEGITLVISSHLLGEVEQVCDRVVVLLHGRLVAEARPGSISVTTKYRVIVGTQETESARDALRAFDIEDAGKGALLVSAKRGRDVSAALAAHGIAPEALIPERPSLEGWYLALTEADKKEARG